jgi:hypothetical protein
MIADRLQHADFAAWERETLRPDGPRYREEVDWWRRAFEPGRPALRLPFSRPTPVPDAAPADGVIHWGIEAGEAAALDELARRAGATPYAVRLALSPRCWAWRPAKRRSCTAAGPRRPRSRRCSVPVVGGPS